MISSLKGIYSSLAYSTLLHGSFPKKISIPRNRLPPTYMHSYSSQTFASKVLQVFEGMTSRQRKQAIIDHQKLWVALVSVNCHYDASVCLQKCHSLQLRSGTMDFGTQEYYSTLLEKGESELTTKDLLELIGLYKFAIGRSPSSKSVEKPPINLLFYLEQKRYEALLRSREKDKPTF